MGTRGSSKKAAGGRPAKEQVQVEVVPEAEASRTAAAGADYDPSVARTALLKLQARHGHVDDAHRAAYDLLNDDATRTLMGTRTRSSGVLRDGVTMAVEIDQRFTEYPALVASHYAHTRFAYFVDRVLALAEAVDHQDTSRHGTGTIRTTAQGREASARKARQDLIGKLKGFAGQRQTEKGALTDAIGATASNDDLGKSIARLVALGRSWLALTDPASRILATSAGLTTQIIDQAVTAAGVLTTASSDATLAGHRPAVDSPAVNLIEGWVTYEMMEAIRCFDEAHADKPVIARLTPGPNTRHVLGPRHGSATAGDPASTGEPDPSTSTPPAGSTPAAAGGSSSAT
jgi:hypothetical protein